MRKLIIIIALFALISTPAAFAQDSSLLLTSGTMQAGGSITLNTTSYLYDDADTEFGGFLSVAPSFGFFVAKGLELQLGANFGVGFGDNSPDWIPIGFSFGVRYIFHFVPYIKPYVGGRLGMTFLLPDEGDKQMSFNLFVPLGILIQLNRHVALNVGINNQFNIDLKNDEAPTVVSSPMGYMGVEAFF
jgi:hypothetical protein